MRAVQSLAVLTTVTLIMPIMAGSAGSRTGISAEAESSEETTISNDMLPFYENLLEEKQNTETYVFKHVGESVNFSCILRENPMNITIDSWNCSLRHYTKLYDTSEQWLYFEQLVESDTAEYKCFWKVGRRLYSHSYYLSVDTVMYKDWRENETAKPFSEVVAPCDAIYWLESQTSPISISIRWFKGTPENRERNIPISEYHRSSWLHLENVTQEDEGWYTCEVNTSFVNNHKSIYVRVMDGFSPTLVDYNYFETKIYRQEGEPINFNLTCNARGKPEPKIEWYTYIGIYNGRNFYQAIGEAEEKLEHYDHSITISNEHFVMISKVPQISTIVYECKLKNVFGTDDHEFAVVGGMAPNTSEQANAHVVLDCRTDTEFYCQGGNQAHVEYKFFHYESVEWVKFKVDPHNPRLSENIPRLQTNSVTNSNNLLHIVQNISDADEGWYTCITRDQFGASYRSIYLKVVDHTVTNSELMTERTVHIAIGESVSLVCEHFSLGHFSWTKENQPILRTAPPAHYSDRFLVFENASFHDGGRYQCENAEYISQKFTFWLIVDTLITVDSMKNTTVAKNTPVIFQCETIFDNSSSVNDKFKIEWFWIRDNNTQKMNSSNRNSLRIENVTENNEGEYICVVNGLYKKSAFLNIIETTSIPLVIVLLPPLFIICLLIVLYFFKSRYLENQRGSIQLKLDNLEAHPYDTTWELPRTQLQLGEKLGEGAFGLVLLAEMHESNAITKVAVKMLKEIHSESDIKDLHYELKMLKLVGNHPNIIKLLGCCTQGGPLYVIVEYVPHGDLLSYLRCPQRCPVLQKSSSDGYINKSPRPNQLISFAVQIARGTEHLASIHCVHRDLAARNILVGAGPVMKICDFGLARDIYMSNYYRKNSRGKLPYKWMAPESLENELYSSQSDVWSFGVLLWEIMTLGKQPYSSIHSWREMVDQLRNGNRLERPESCPEDVFGLMNDCWKYQSEERPSFGEILQRLDCATMEAGGDRVNAEEDSYSRADDSSVSESE